MKNKDFIELVKRTQRNTSALLIAKGQEYAGEADRLSNFKRGSTNTGMTPLQVCFIYMSKHYDSLATYVKKDAGGYTQILAEPIDGRLDDLINYCILMKALIQESASLDKDKVHRTFLDSLHTEESSPPELI